MDKKLFDYYQKLMAPPFNVSIDTIVLAAREFLTRLLPDLAPEYLARQSWDRLVIGLRENGAQVCAQCFTAKACGEFYRLLDVRNRCQACRRVNLQARINRKVIRKKQLRAGRRELIKLVGQIDASPAVRRRLMQVHCGVKPSRDNHRIWRAPADSEQKL